MMMTTDYQQVGLSRYLLFVLTVTLPFSYANHKSALPPFQAGKDDLRMQYMYLSLFQPFWAHAASWIDSQASVKH